MDFDMSIQPEEVLTQESKSIFIQKLDEETLKIYKELGKTKELKEANFSSLHSNKVKPAALIDLLVKYRDLFDSEMMKVQMQALIISIDNMGFGGASTMSICHNNGEESKLEFICIIAYKYYDKEGVACGKCKTCKACKQFRGCGFCRTCKACEKLIACKACKACKDSKASTPYKCNEPISCGTCDICERCRIPMPCGRCEECIKCETSVACDYLITLYSYNEKVNRAGLNIGKFTIAGGIILGAIFLPVGIATGGTAFTIVGAIAAGVAAGGGTTTGGIIISKSVDTTIDAKLRNYLRACFVFELVREGNVEIISDKLYLKIKDSD